MHRKKHSFVPRLCVLPVACFASPHISSLYIFSNQENKITMSIISLTPTKTMVCFTSFPFLPVQSKLYTLQYSSTNLQLNSTSQSILKLKLEPDFLLSIICFIKSSSDSSLPSSSLMESSLDIRLINLCIS